MICNFSPIAFSVLGLEIRWYSLAYIFGLILALKLTTKLSIKFKTNFSKEMLNDFVSYAIFGIIIGGRLGHVLFYDWQYYSSCPLDIFKLWKGGMSFYGGFLSVIVSTMIFCKTRKISFLEFIDLWSISVPIGLFFGRIANFVNGELLGTPSNISWNVVFSDGIARHPSQIYEALLEGVLLFALMMLAANRKLYKIKGALSGTFCLGYGTARFISEFFREPDSSFSASLLNFTGLNLNQYFSVAMVILGIIVLFMGLKNAKSSVITV